jgi:hypothetical protein
MRFDEVRDLGSHVIRLSYDPDGVVDFGLARRIVKELAYTVF